MDHLANILYSASGDREKVDTLVGHIDQVWRHSSQIDAGHALRISQQLLTNVYRNTVRDVQNINLKDVVPVIWSAIAQRTAPPDDQRYATGDSLV